MLVRFFIVLGMLVALASPTSMYALPACSGQRFYLKTGEGLDVEFNRKPGCDVRFMTVQQGAVERRLFYPSGKTDTRVISPIQPDVSEAWADLPTKAYLRASAETIVRFTAERPVQAATQPTPATPSALPPKQNEAPTRVLVENMTNEAITHYWIDPSGREINYGNIAPGATATLNTFDRHVWRIKRTNNGQTIRQFTATPATVTIRIDPSDLPTMPIATKVPPQQWFQGFNSSAASPFSRGARITTTDTVNVRAGPTLSASVSGAVQNRAQGTIVDGPHTQDGYTWWRVRYDNGLEGWTADKFIRIAAAGQPRQQPQRVNPRSQPSGGTSMGFLNNLWSFAVMIFCLGLIGGLIYAIIKTVKSIPSVIFSHWYTLIENLNCSSIAFYQSVETNVGTRQVPNSDLSRVHWPEGGVFSARREYLRVKRKDLIFDICAAPFGNGFFVSWWLGPKPGLLGFFYALPIFGIVLQYLTRPFTYYKIDTALMFQESIRKSVQEIIDELTKAQGLRALTDDERKPIMRNFFQR